MGVFRIQGHTELFWVVVCVPASLCLRFSARSLRLDGRQYQARSTAAITAIPPTTPPTMAPIGVLLPPDLLSLACALYGQYCVIVPG